MLHKCSFIYGCFLRAGKLQMRFQGQGSWHHDLLYTCCFLSIVVEATAKSFGTTTCLRTGWTFALATKTLQWQLSIVSRPWIVVDISC